MLMYCLCLFWNEVSHSVSFGCKVMVVGLASTSYVFDALVDSNAVLMKAIDFQGIIGHEADTVNADLI